MRELLSLRRDEAPVIGEIYKYSTFFVECVADDDDDPMLRCSKCCFDVESCGSVCDSTPRSSSHRYFKLVPGDERETAADVKIRYIEETKKYLPKIGEKFTSMVGLVELVKTCSRDVATCSMCDLTLRECRKSRCLMDCYYRRVTQ